MAVTENLYVGDGVTDIYALSFPYLEEDEVKVTLDEVGTTAFTFLTASSIQFTSPPGGGVDIRIYRDTNVDSKKATFAAGTSIRAVDLNENFDQTLYYSQETRALVVNAALGDIPDGSLGTAKIADGAVTTAKLADDAVTAAKIADDAVVTARIQDSAVTAAKIAADAVTTAKILNDAVTNDKIADTAVNTAQLASSAVTTDKIADDAVTTVKLDSTGIAPTVTAINGGPLAGFRNAIINGNFDIWQRGTSHTAVGYGSADRWSNTRNGTACTMSRQAFTLGQTDVPGEPTYFCRMAVTSVAGAGNYSQLNQRIEGVRTFAGQTVTVSFWAKADAARPIAIEFRQEFGTGGSPSSVVTGIGSTKVQLSTSWQKVTVTVSIPSVSGKTLGTDDNDLLRMNIWFDAGSDFDARTDTLGQQSGTFDIAQVQVEAGSVATPFERRPIGTELALCQRYYCSTFGSVKGYIANAGQTAGTHVYWPVTMRDTPSVTDSGGSLTNVSSIAVDFLSHAGAMMRAAVNTTVPGYVDARNRVINADAEL